MALLSGVPRPRLSGGIVHVYDQDDPRRSDNTLLVAALLALGIPAATEEFFHSTCEVSKGARVWRTQWTLREQSKCGRYNTPAMVRVWNEGAWLCANPKHPLAILRSGLTYAKAFSYTPRFTLAELAKIETADTWIEAAIYNLVVLLRDMPEALRATRNIIQFGPHWGAFVPQCAPEAQKTRLLKHVENHKRHMEALAA